MATEVRLRRGTTAQHAGFTGAQAELTIDTTKKTAVVHDGVTPGGFPLSVATDVAGKANAGANSDITSLSGLTTPLSIPQGGTGAITAGAARTALGATTVGAAVFTAVDAPTALTAIGGVSAGAIGLVDSAVGVSMINGTLVSTVNANALTIAVKTKAGTDPSASDPVLLLFRNTTATTGDYTVIRLTAALSVVASSGSTGGTTSGVPSRFWVTCFNDAGTPRLSWINCRDSSLNIYPLSEGALVSSIAEGGAGAADSAGVFYTGTAVTAKAYTILGYVEFTQAAAGTYATAPSIIQLFGPGVHKPGEIVQRKRNQTGAVATGVTIMPYDDTIPQITEGNEYMTQAITPFSAANIISAATIASMASSVNTGLVGALFQDATVNALAAMVTEIRGVDTQGIITFTHDFVATSTATTTLRFRAGTNGGATMTFNGVSSARRLGGVSSSSLTVLEIMG